MKITPPPPPASSIARILIISGLMLLSTPTMSTAYVRCPGSSTCTGCDLNHCGSCSPCTGIGPGSSCVCHCLPCYSMGEGTINTRPHPLDPGESLSGTFRVENEDATLTTVLNAFIWQFNWNCTFASGIDPNDYTVGDIDFNAAASAVLASLTDTFDLCVETDSTNYELTFRAEGDCD